MKRVDKKAERKQKAIEHRNRRNEKYFKRINAAREIGYRIPLYVINKYGTTGYWADSSSYTGYSQKCSYIGICPYPCDGDC